MALEAISWSWQEFLGQVPSLRLETATPCACWASCDVKRSPSRRVGPSRRQSADCAAGHPDGQRHTVEQSALADSLGQRSSAGMSAARDKIQA